MLASHARTLVRPLSTRTTQCLRQPQRTPKSISPWQAQPQLRRHRYTRAGEERPSLGRNIKVLWRENPFSVTLAFGFIAFGIGSWIYINYIYQSYFIGAFHKFPEPVAKQLRKALFYTNYQIDAKLALKYYKEALRVAAEEKMNPFSDEILGVKIQVAALMEKVQQYKKAIDVLEIVKRDCLDWIEKRGSIPGNEGDRTRILGKTVGISVKLGDLYGNQYVMEKDLAEDRLVWAVETVLRESQRRQQEGVKAGEGEWLSDEENGAALEALANNYEEKDQHYLAAPLYLQAIALSPITSCHTTVLMNNLSISLAQQLPPLEPGQKSLSREMMVENARLWAQKALAVAEKITPPDRTDECDVGCAVATHNLGEFAEMDGNIKEARNRYAESKALAEVIGFQDGIQNSDTALKRLGKT